MVADVTNTPWREKHAYVLGPLGRPRRQGAGARSSRKAFHVSPFMEMDMEYRWLLRPPADDLLVGIENHDAEGQLFDATLALNAGRWTGGTWAVCCGAIPGRRPKVVGGIYWQALRLWAKTCALCPPPRRPGQGDVDMN